MESQQPVPQPPRPPVTPPQEAGKPAAILSYFGPIGLLIAYVLNQSEKAPLASYHFRQGVGLLIIYFIAYAALFVVGFIPGIRYINWLLLPALGIGGLILTIMGIIAAANGEMKPLPVVGEEIQSRLANVG